MSGKDGWKAATRPEGIVVRACRPSDQPVLESLGHPPALARIFCAPPERLLLWRLIGRRAHSVVAADGRTGVVLGSVQFLRSPLSPDTWMFGHWRVTAQYRRRGIGRLLLAEGLKRLTGPRRLFSYVSADNAVSIAAHERLGFEIGGTLWGRAPLGALSTLGAPTPALRLDPVRPADRDALFGIYARAVGALRLRLFPEIGAGNFLGGGLRGLRVLNVATVRESSHGVPGRPGGVRSAQRLSDSGVAGFVIWEGSRPTFFAVPEVCDQGLLARLAIRLLTLGARRDAVVELRGLPRPIADRPGGPLDLQELMGMPDIATQWRE